MSRDRRPATAAGAGRPSTRRPWPERTRQASRLARLEDPADSVQPRTDQDRDRLGDVLRAGAAAPTQELDDWWDYRLFGRVLEDELDRRAPLRREIENPSAPTDDGTWVGVFDFGSWVLARMSELEGLMETTEAILNDDLAAAFEGEDAPGDPLGVVAAAHRLAQVWEDAARWRLRCRSVGVDLVARRAADLVSDASATILDGIWEFGHTFLPRVEEAIDKHGDNDSEEVVVVPLTLKFDADFDELREEISRLPDAVAAALEGWAPGAGAGY
jgi:hypothetical protein